MDAIVVGAGLSGLVAAHRLVSRGLAVQLLEAQPRAGGVIGSVVREGFLFERAANSALDNHPAIAALLADLDLQPQRVPVSSRATRRYVVRNGRPVALPLSPRGLIGSSALSLPGKVRLLREPFIAAARQEGEESVAAFITRRLGPEALDYLADPFVSGIFAGDPARLSVQAAMPRLVALEREHGSLLRGQLAIARQRKAARSSARSAAPTFHSFSFRTGMQVLTDALATRLPITLGSRVHSIGRVDAGLYRIDAEVDGMSRSFRARSVLLAVPAFQAATLVSQVAPGAVAALAAIEYAPVAVIVSAHRAMDVAHPLDGFGMLVPTVERRELLGTLFSSTMFEGRAPAGQVLLTSFVGGTRMPGVVERDDAALKRLVANEHATLLGAQAPLWQEAWRWHRAIPQYTLGHADRNAAIERATASGLLRLVGNWRDGVSVGDCIANADRAACELAERLASESAPRA